MMTLRFWALLPATILMSMTVNAQARLVVRVLDRLETPLEYAAVRISAGAQGTRSDAEGFATFEGVAAGRHELLVCRLGYKCFRDTIVVVQGNRRPTTIRLHAAELLATSPAARGSREPAATGGLDSVAARMVRRDTSATIAFRGLSTKLLAALVRRRTRDSSTIVSGLSVGQALTTLLPGAAGATDSALRAAFEIGVLPLDSVLARSRQLAEQYRVRRDVTLALANAVWVDTSRRVRPEYRRMISRLGPDVLRATGLRTAAAVEAINAWASRATNGMIREVLDRPFADSTMLMLVNALYFKGVWLVPFDKSATQTDRFVTANGSVLDVPMMQRRFSTAYERGDRWQSVRIPFRTGRTSFYVILPDSGVAATELLQSRSDLASLLPSPSSEQREVDLRLPRLSAALSANLIPAFRDVGLGVLTDSVHANLRGVMELRPTENLVVDRAVQLVRLELDEAGAEAAAVTAISGGVVLLSVPPPPIPFIVNRPFLFVLQDDVTGTPLFVGYIASPATPR
jgi:serine protease inhibitor